MYHGSDVVEVVITGTGLKVPDRHFFGKSEAWSFESGTPGLSRASLNKPSAGIWILKPDYTCNATTAALYLALRQSFSWLHQDLARMTENSPLCHWIPFISTDCLRLFRSRTWFHQQRTAWPAAASSPSYVYEIYIPSFGTNGSRGLSPSASLEAHQNRSCNVSQDLIIENLVLEICFLTQLKKTLGCAKTLSEASWLSILEHLSHSSEVCRSLLLSVKNLTPSWCRPKLLPSLKVRMWYVCHVSYYLYCDYAVNLNIFCSTAHICTMLYGKMLSSKHYLKLKTNAFLCAPGLDSTDMK